jgi:hypothetical protein
MFGGELKVCNCDGCRDVEVCSICGMVKVRLSHWGEIKFGYHCNITEYDQGKVEFIEELMSCNENTLRNVL